MSLYRAAAGPAALARAGPTPETMSTCSTKTRGLCFGTQYDVRLLTVLPGRTAGAEQLTLRLREVADRGDVLVAVRSTWVAPIITCRLP